MQKKYLTCCLVFTIMAAVTVSLRAQQEQDLLSLLGREETTEYAAASFKTNRVINMHSLESTAAGVLDVKISHRFGQLNQGPYGLFGLDGPATIRIGFDYGISDRLTVGVGRSSLLKTYDGFLKFKLLRQSTGLKKMPVTVAFLAAQSIQSVKWGDTLDHFASDRLSYTFQAIIGRKFSNGFTLQVSPTLVHRNLVATKAEENDVLALGAAGRIKLSKRLALNAEYVYIPPGQIDETKYRNYSLSLGFDIETGGHVFQLHFTNSQSMIEPGVVTQTEGNWAKGGIHFGFNVSRVFTIAKPKE